MTQNTIRTIRKIKQGTIMSGDTLAEVTSLLENVISLDKSIYGVVLCTKEGVPVASFALDDSMKAQFLSTISAALFWAGTTALSYLSESKATYFSIETPDDKILAILQPNYHLVIILKADKPDTDIETIIPQLQSIAVRIEILMNTNELVPTETTLDKIVKAIPEIQQAMILTTEGLPVEAVGFENNIEIAALAGSIFANGLTFSQVTESVTITAEGIAILVNRVDQQRILIVSFRGSQALDSCKRVKNLLHDESTS